MKQCSKCGEWKELDEFYFRKDWNKYINICKLCCKKHAVEYRKNNKEKIAERAKIHHKKQYQKNRKQIIERVTIYAQEHKEEKKEYHKGYYQEHKEERKERGKEYQKNKLKTDPKYKLNKNISCLIRQSLKGNKNGQHWEICVDYTLEDLMFHLKNTLPAGFTWQDYLDGRLHLDHIVPVSVFNFDSYTNVDFRRCWALSNLRLLEATKNMSKGNKIDKPFQPYLKIGSVND